MGYTTHEDEALAMFGHRLIFTSLASLTIGVAVPVAATATWSIMRGSAPYCGQTWYGVKHVPTLTFSLGLLHGSVVTSLVIITGPGIIPFPVDLERYCTMVELHTDVLGGYLAQHQLPA